MQWNKDSLSEASDCPPKAQFYYWLAKMHTIEPTQTKGRGSEAKVDHLKMKKKNIARFNIKLKFDRQSS